MAWVSRRPGGTIVPHPVNYDITTFASEKHDLRGGKKARPAQSPTKAQACENSFFPEGETTMPGIAIQTDGAHVATVNFTGALAFGDTAAFTPLS
jgi:hypothetical protein